MKIKIYFNDLSGAKQKEIFAAAGTEYINPTKPLAEIEIYDYQIIEFKSEDRYLYRTKRAAKRAFKNLRRIGYPGIWQLFYKQKMVDEFVAI